MLPAKCPTGSQNQAQRVCSFRQAGAIFDLNVINLCTAGRALGTAATQRYGEAFTRLPVVGPEQVGGEEVWVK